MTYRLREDSMPMDSITFAIDASGENFGFDGQGDEAMAALEDFGASENAENGTWTMVLDDFKDWCDTYGLDPTSKEFIITDESGEEIEDINSLIYDTGDDIQDAGIADSEDDMPDDFFDDVDSEDVDIEDDDYWDDAEELDPSSIGEGDWARAGETSEDDDEFAGYQQSYKRSLHDDGDFMSALNLDGFDGESIHESKKSTKSRLKEDTSAFIASPKAAEEKEIPDWVMKAFKESVKETKMLKEWIEKPGESIWDKYNRLALYSKKIFSLADEVRSAGGDEYAAQLEDIARKMR
jgi:hypothetical protein